MPGESDVANGQVPELQVQNEDNETVILQNGGPKKVEIEKTEIQTIGTENDQKCELTKEEPENQANESGSEQTKELEKVESDTPQSEPEQCQLKQAEPEGVQAEPEQCQLKQAEPETVEPEPEQCPIKQLEAEDTDLTCPLRSTTQIEETKTETERSQPDTEIQQTETDNAPQCDLKKVEQDEEVSSCPLISATRVEEEKEEVVTNGQQNQEIVQNGSPKKVSMFTTLDSDAIKAAYEDVRSDGSETQWAVFKFQGSKIALSATGAEFEKFREQFTENERGFGYIRIQTGDEMSKRQKFLFVTWIGPGVSVIQRAKMSTDKSLVKSIISNFAVELQLENESDFDLKHFVMELNKAGGANYGTGIRDY